jgi:polysaccharide pyruvyl transferase WcaK-like protein
LIENIKTRIPEADIIGFSGDPYDTAKRHNIKAVRYYWKRDGQEGVHVGKRGSLDTLLKTLFEKFPPAFFAFRVLRRFFSLFRNILDESAFTIQCFLFLRDFRILVITGGGQLCDYWGGAWAHPYTLFKWGALAKLSGTKFVILSVGAGPIGERLSKIFIRLAIGMADYLSFRDGASKRLVESFCRNIKAKVYPDLAFSLNPGEVCGLRRSEIRNTIVGMSPISHDAFRNQPEAVYEKYLNAFTDMVIWLRERDYPVMLFPSDVGMDIPVIEEVRGRLHARLGTTKLLGVSVPCVLELRDLLRELSMVKMVIASRLHGVLLSHVLGIPVLALSHHGKVEAHMGNMDQRQYCVKIEAVNTKVLIENFLKLEKTREEIGEKVRNRRNSYKYSLEEQYERVFGREWNAASTGNRRGKSDSGPVTQ